MKELLQKKTIKIGISVIILAVAVGLISINARSAQRRRECDSHVEAAEKYLTELDYEQAIAEYALALEIEPNNEEVLNALEQTYLDYAQSLADAGEYEKAVSVLEEGYAQIGRESLREKIVRTGEEVAGNIIAAWSSSRVPIISLESPIRWTIDIFEKYEESHFNLTDLYEYMVCLGEKEYEEKWRDLWEEQRAMSPERITLENGIYIIRNINSYEDFTEQNEMERSVNGNYCEYGEITCVHGCTERRTSEYVGGKEIRVSSFAQYNCDGCECYGSHSDDISETSSTWEYEYDSLGRIKMRTTTSIFIYIIDGFEQTVEGHEKRMYTYTEAGFTEVVTEEQFIDGGKSSDSGWKCDYKITDIFGTCISGKVYDNYF